MKQISDFEIVNHGIDNSQYFQGCGTYRTNFLFCSTGCGESAKDAFEDCIEQIFQMDFDADKIKKSKEGKKYQTKSAKKYDIQKYLRDGKYSKPEIEKIFDDGCDLYYYLSVRWNEKL